MKLFQILQNLLIAISLFLLAYLPLYSAFGLDEPRVRDILYQISFICVWLVILVRPLADIFYRQKWLRRLVFFRKGFGILSASIVVGYLLGNIVSPESSYLQTFCSVSGWSLANCAIFARLGEITGLMLLITSNNFSIAVLRGKWQWIQELAYVYFYAGGLYELCAFDSAFAFYTMVIAAMVSLWAIIVNKRKNIRSALA